MKSKTMEKHVEQFNRRQSIFRLEYIEWDSRGHHVIKCTETATGKTIFHFLPGRAISDNFIQRFKRDFSLLPVESENSRFLREYYTTNTEEA